MKTSSRNVDRTLQSSATLIIPRFLISVAPVRVSRELFTEAESYEKNSINKSFVLFEFEMWHDSERNWDDHHAMSGTRSQGLTFSALPIRTQKNQLDCSWLSPWPFKEIFEKSLIKLDFLKLKPGNNWFPFSASDYVTLTSRRLFLEDSESIAGQMWTWNWIFKGRMSSTFLCLSAVSFTKQWFWVLRKLNQARLSECKIL